MNTDNSQTLEAATSWLFDTQALKIAPADKPFWTTSGLLSPYYINTHFLCGGPETAVEVLALIDAEQGNTQTFHETILGRLWDVCHLSDIYRNTIALLVEETGREFPLGEIDFIAGGQRRDWFFAPLVAHELDRPLLYTYNDLSLYHSDGRPADDIKGAGVLNIADLLTVGSSYTEKWVPAMKQRGAKLRWSINVVDRIQGGVENLQGAGIEKVHSLFHINLALFQEAMERGYINSGQFDLAKQYIEDPSRTMKEFLVGNKAFLVEALGSADERTRQRATKLVQEDLYSLGEWLGDLSLAPTSTAN